MAMRRADRKTSNDDNAINHPRSIQKEPTPRRELEQRLATVRAQRDEWKQKVKENEQAAIQLAHVQGEVDKFKNLFFENETLYHDEQKKHQQALILYDQERAKTTELLTKYEEVNSQLTIVVTERDQLELQYQNSLTLYDNEKTKFSELLVKYEESNSQKEQYIQLYNQAQEDLQFERRSKAGIKGWNTRRKKENERLKQEIGQMTLLLKESLERKEEAIDNLYVMAERMDKIQQLVDSVEGESTNTPVAFLDKLKQIWIAIKDILAE